MKLTTIYLIAAFTLTVNSFYSQEIKKNKLKLKELKLTKHEIYSRFYSKSSILESEVFVNSKNNIYSKALDYKLPMGQIEKDNSLFLDLTTGTQDEYSLVGVFDFETKTSKKTTTSLILGISYINSERLSNYSNIENKRFQGITYSQDYFNYVITDYFYMSDYSSRVKENIVSLQTGALLNFRRNKMFSLYSGLIINTGFGFNSKIKSFISFSESNVSTFYHIGIDEYLYSDAKTGQIHPYLTIEEEDQLSNFLFLRTKLPIGFNLRLSKQENFLSKIGINLEMSFNSSHYIQKETKHTSLTLSTLFGLSYLI